MQESRNGFGGGRQQQSRIASLRAQVQSNAQLGKPPKPRKGVQRDSDEERAVKAERQAMAQHSTSLLSDGKSKKSYKRPGEREEKKGGGLVWQLLLVVIVAGGVAYALDPTIVPADWIDQARTFIGQYVKI